MKQTRHIQPIVTDVHSFSHDGRGIAIIDGKTTFITGALAFEKVACKITKHHRRYNEALAVTILEPAKERTEPHCAHFSACGGCSMQHMDIGAQIALKQKTLLEQLQHFGKVIPETVLPPLVGSSWGYRRKARLGVYYNKDQKKLIVGFRKKNSNSLVNIHSCPILHSQLPITINALNELIASLSQFEHIPQVEVAVSDTATALIFRHLTPLPPDDIKKLCAFAEHYSIQLYLQPNAPAKTHPIWPIDQQKKLAYWLPDYQLEMQFEPTDFIQVNAEMNQRLIQQAMTLLDPTSTDHILDLFCGLGNFTLPIAKTAKLAIGIEGSQEMVTRAQHNAQHNQIHNTEFYAANLSDPSPKATWMQKKYDKILLDPPRTGAKEVIEFFPKLAAKRIVYVSCNLATLARDAGRLVYNQGYQLKQVGLINMFPHTNHIEAIAMFEK